MNTLPVGDGELVVGASRWSLVDAVVAISLGPQCLVEVFATSTEPHGPAGERAVSFWTQLPRPAGLTHDDATALEGMAVELRELEGAEAAFLVELPSGETKDGVLYADGGQRLVIERVDEDAALVTMRASFSLELYEERASERVDVAFRCRGAIVWNTDV